MGSQEGILLSNRFTVRSFGVKKQLTI